MNDSSCTNKCQLIRFPTLLPEVLRYCIGIAGIEPEKRERERGTVLKVLSIILSICGKGTEKEWCDLANKIFDL